MYNRDYIGCLFFIFHLKIPQYKYFVKDLVRRRQNSFLCSFGETKHLNYRPPSVVFSSRHRYRLKLIFGGELLSAFDESANLEKAMTGATGCCTNEI